MKRLSDRAFQIVKDEVDRYYTPQTNAAIPQAPSIEHIILLARLETLHDRSGKQLTSVQIWEELCDILPQIDREILAEAGRRHTDSPLMGTSLCVCAASLGTAALLLASPLGSGAQAIEGSSKLSTQINFAIATAELPVSNRHQETFKRARSLGWQASLKGKNPPHNAEHWGETAALWQQALTLLDQVPRYDASYAIAQAKKAEYQNYLQQIQARQLSAQNRMLATDPAPRFSQTPPANAKPKASAPKTSDRLSYRKSDLGPQANSAPAQPAPFITLAHENIQVLPTFTSNQLAFSEQVTH